MNVIKTEIPDVLIFEPKVFGDERGFFFESFNQKVFEEAVGRKVEFVQDNHSKSCKGVLRGLHYQLEPYAQGKLVRCVVGEVFDVAVDIRKSSPTFGKWVGVNLSAENKRQLWIPEGFAHCAKHLIFRTSWVYAGKGNNFAKTMLRLAKEREELAVINDQFGAPTGAELLADCTAHAIRVALNKPEVAGLYHLVASGTTTWHDYAALVFEEARKAGIPLALNKLNAVSTTAYPTPARRPHNSRLNTEKFQQNFALVLPDWQVGVKRMLNELFTTTAI